MRIPDETINEIRNASSIVDIIGTHVRLKKRGKNYTGLCPFHTEKSPSFSVSEEKGMYYCFGCGKGGDVIKFVMEWEKSSYVEAIEMLAGKAGIKIIRGEERDKGASDETEKLYLACTMAAKFFYRNLMNSDEGKLALDYFRKRGFSDLTMTSFGLGYSLRSWDGLITEAGNNGIHVSVLEKVGLVRKRDDGHFYDAFRGRCMFPIFSPAGKVIAFGARKLYDDDPLGKYINSPETVIYHKSKVLYGLFQAKEAIREKESALLVEGYADLISVVQAGVRNIVASSGTALTAEQIQMIGRYSKNIIFVYDADTAGTNAMLRGVDLILEEGLDVRIVELPQGEDPDSFVRKNGVDALQKEISSAISFLEFKARSLEREGKLNTPEGKAESVRFLVQTIAKMKDPLRHSFFIKDLAAKFKLYESSLYTELEKHTKKGHEKFYAQQPAQGAVNAAPEKEFSAEHPAELLIEETELLTLLFENPAEMIPFVFKYIQPEEFAAEGVREVVNRILDSYDLRGTVDSAEILGTLSSDSVRRTLHHALFEKHRLDERWIAIGAKPSELLLWEQAEGAIKKLKKRPLEKELSETGKKLKNAALTGEDSLELLRHHHELLAKIKEIDKIKLVGEKKA